MLAETRRHSAVTIVSEISQGEKRGRGRNSCDALDLGRISRRAADERLLVRGEAEARGLIVLD